jgi:hypothetical protein
MAIEEVFAVQRVWRGTLVDITTGPGGIRRRSADLFHRCSRHDGHRLVRGPAAEVAASSVEAPRT